MIYYFTLKSSKKNREKHRKDYLGNFINDNLSIWQHKYFSD
jgi:hypothetical protein